MTYQMLLLYTAPDNFTAEMLMAALREKQHPCRQARPWRGRAAQPLSGQLL